MTTNAAAVDVARRVDEVAQWVAAAVGRLAALVEDQLARDEPRRADLAIEEPCRELLAQHEVPLAGAGFVAATGLLADSPYWLEWWTADPAVGIESCRRLAAETDPTSVGFRDYTELPWFATPRETGRLHVTGPYVDYVCTDQHTLTTTHPVRRRGEFAGVVGVDMLAASMESLLLPGLDAVPGTCVVVNRAGRVVAASDPHWVAGDLVRGLPLGAWFDGTDDEPADGWTFVACATTPLGVLVRG
ncbi:MAG TPA: cache domain-containing protein [Phycicoccus sp.]